MTICISCVCEDEGKDIIVIATDHMIDVGIGQFEHDIQKHKKIHGKNIAMLSGSALLFNDLIMNLEEKKEFEEIKKGIYENFCNMRKNIVKEQLLDKFGLKEEEIKEIIKGEIKNPIIGKLIESISKFKLNTSILLVGFDNRLAKISEIQEEGFADYTDVHFHAIGSGQIQAINTLLFQKQLKKNSLKTTIYNVYKAKRNAEVSSGVGIETDMLILAEDGCLELSEGDINILREIYDNELKMGKNSEDLNKLNIFK